MNETQFFLHQIRRTNGAYDKGIVVKETLDAAKQGYFAYLGAYGFDHDPNTDYVQCMITDIHGNIHASELWIRPEVTGE